MKLALYLLDQFIDALPIKNFSEVSQAYKLLSEKHAGIIEASKKPPEFFIENLPSKANKKAHAQP